MKINLNELRNVENLIYKANDDIKISLSMSSDGQTLDFHVINGTPQCYPSKDDYAAKFESTMEKFRKLVKDAKEGKETASKGQIDKLVETLEKGEPKKENKSPFQNMKGIDEILSKMDEMLKENE